MGADSAPILEVFASYQGEGLFVGEPETFLRLAGCPLRCRYCDTTHSWAVPAEDDDTWLTPFGAMLRVAEAELDPRRPIAVTGGEPLAWPDFLLGLADVAGDRPLRLETAGHDLDALERVLRVFDHLSLDLKLGDDLAAPTGAGFQAAGRDPGELPDDGAAWDSLRPRQLALALEHLQRGGTAALKLVVTPGTDPARFDTILDDLTRLAPDLPLFLAPASRPGGEPYDLEPVDALAARALGRGLAPRVLPQLHRALGVR